MLNGLGQLLKVLNNPRLKIVDSIIEHSKINSGDETKVVSFVIKNTGGKVAIDYKCTVRIKENWENFYNLYGVFDLYPDDKKANSLCNISKRAGVHQISNYPPFDMGKIYTVEIKFYGRNFLDKKVHSFKLDLSSWENIGIELDC